MIAADLRIKIDHVWDAFWSAGIANPLEVVEQITYLMFIWQLEDVQATKERKANRTGEPIENPVYAEETEVLRWSRFSSESPENMLAVVRDQVFPWLRNLEGADFAYAHHMKDARFTIPTANLLSKVVETLDDMPLGEPGTKGDVYEYMLSKIAMPGRNGQFHTPRHIIQLIVEMMAPSLIDEICDPACGTAGFLVESAVYVNRTHKNALLDVAQRQHFNQSMFHGFDFDSTMLRIASMNMLLHEVEQPDIRYHDSLAEGSIRDADRYSMILTNPPFGGTRDYESTAENLQAVVKTKKTELLFLALFLRLLKPGGRAAVIVPDGVLFGATQAHRELRRILVEDQKLDAVVKLPVGTFKPYAGVSASILFFTRTDSGSSDNVWFYEVMADGWSLNDKRAPLLSEDKLGPVPISALNEADHEKNNLPDVLARWARRDDNEHERLRSEQSFCVPRDDIAAQGYDLSFNRYKEIKVEFDSAGHGSGVEFEDSETWIREPFDPEKIDVVTRTPTVSLLLSRIRRRTIDLAPDFQRRAGIWREGNQSRLIESLLLRIPLPTFYAAENDDETWAIVDGIQRLTAIARFVDPAALGLKPLVLEGLGYLKFNGCRFDDLPGRLKTRLEETEVVLHLIRRGTPEEVKYNIFARINTGGIALSSQELRHALIPGKARILLGELAESEQFNQATLGSVASSRMADREMVLRFIAFDRANPSGYAFQDFDQFLRRAMEDINSASNAELEVLKSRFLRAMWYAREIFGRHAFRKQFRGQPSRSPINKALFETVSVNLAGRDEAQLEELVHRKSDVNDALIELIADSDFERAISVGTGDVAKVRKRFSEVDRLFSHYDGSL